MAAGNRAELIRQYREGPEVLAAAVFDMTDEELDRKPEDGGWSAREVVHHTADSEMTSAVRLRRLVAEANPVISGYDPDAFAQALHYGRRPIGPSLDAIRGARESTASILESLDEEQWARAGTHDELGPYSIDTWLEIYAVHCHGHADQALRAAARETHARS